MNPSEQRANSLVMGLVKGYKLKQIKPFLDSLRNCGYQGDICLLVSGLSPETQREFQEYAKQHRVILHPFREISLFKVPQRQKNGQLCFKAVQPHHLLQFSLLNQLYIQAVNAVASRTQENPYQIKARISKRFLNTWCIRFPLYYLYLLEHGQFYQKVMLTDTRDVLFQADPFDFEFDQLCCFLEDKGKTIQSCDYNSNWIRRGFDDTALQEIGQETISCSGTTIGTREAIMRYLEMMVTYLVELKTQFWGIDQGVHNYVIRKGLVGEVKFYENHQGPVLTMHHTGDEQIRFNEDGYVVNNDGSIINVLHQYDRQNSEIKNKMLIYRECECVL